MAEVGIRPPTQPSQALAPPHRRGAIRLEGVLVGDVL